MGMHVTHSVSRLLAGLTYSEGVLAFKLHGSLLGRFAGEVGTNLAPETKPVRGFASSGC